MYTLNMTVPVVGFGLKIFTEIIRDFVARSIISTIILHEQCSKHFRLGLDKSLQICCFLLRLIVFGDVRLYIEYDQC